MSEIKAIETEYNGIRFRSRLEARWAVFFDAAGEKYEYEPDSFMLDGMGYVPDFYLPNHDLYVEVKPFREGAFLEVSKTLGLIGTGRIKSLMILSNLPEGVNSFFAYPAIFLHPVVKDIEVDRIAFMQDGPDGGIHFFPHYLERPLYIDWFIDREEDFFAVKVINHKGEYRHCDLHKCFTKAKAYRFD